MVNFRRCLTVSLSVLCYSSKCSDKIAQCEINHAVHCGTPHRNLNGKSRDKFGIENWKENLKRNYSGYNGTIWESTLIRPISSACLIR